MKNENIFFKRAVFGGFKREEVMSYIEGLQQKIHKKEAEIQSLRKKTSTLITQNDNLLAENEKQLNETLVLTEKNTVLSDKAEASAQQFVELEEKIISLEEENVVLIKDLNESNANCEKLQNRTYTGQSLDMYLDQIEKFSFKIKEEVEALRKEPREMVEEPIPERTTFANAPRVDTSRVDSPYEAPANDYFTPTKTENEFTKLKHILMQKLNENKTEKKLDSVSSLFSGIEQTNARQTVSAEVEMKTATPKETQDTHPAYDAAREKFTFDFDRLGAFFSEEQIEKLKKHQKSQ